MKSMENPIKPKYHFDYPQCPSYKNKNKDNINAVPSTKKENKKPINPIFMPLMMNFQKKNTLLLNLYQISLFLVDSLPPTNFNEPSHLYEAINNHSQNKKNGWRERK